MICLTQDELIEARETLRLLERSFTVQSDDEYRQLVRDVLNEPLLYFVREEDRTRFKETMLNRVLRLQQMLRRGA